MNVSKCQDFKDARKQTLLGVLKQITEYFKDINIPTPRLDAEILLSYGLNFSRVELYTHYDYKLNKKELKMIKKLVERRVSREPIAYITGIKEFYGLEFKVSKDVLIPRPETELLVETILKFNFKNASLLDIGTGSGNIAITLKKFNSSLNVTAIDISLPALQIAKYNAEKIIPNLPITFIHSDLFDNINAKYDIIVSNPPYIPSQIIATLMPDVRNYEPISALDGGIDGMQFYKRIIPSAPKFLNKNGFIFLEINPLFTQKIISILEKNRFYNIKVIKDYSNNERIVWAQIA